MRAKLRPQPGFSLIELLIVLTLIGLLAALATPMVSSSVRNAHLKAATKKTAAIFRYARNQAVATKRPYWVVVDREEGWVAVMDRPLNTQEGEDRFEKAMVVSSSGTQLYEYPEDVGVAEVLIGEDGRIDVQGAFIFFPNGNCSGGSVALQRDDVRTATVSLDFITGTVTIDHGTEETN